MRKWWPLVAVCLGAFMLLVDVTIVNVALPDMADDLHAGFSALQWVVDAYALALAALLLAAGSLADLFGHRKLYVTGLTIFALASLACGLAPNAGALVAARAAQGVGGAAMFATSAALLGATYQGRDRGMAFGIWGAVNGAAAAAGPVLGGLLTQHIGWQAIFLVNLPVAAAAILLTLRVLRTDRPDGQAPRERMDISGAVTFTLTAAAATYGLIRGNESGWTSASTLGAFALAALSLVAFILLETRVNRRGGRPMLDLALLRRPPFAALMGGALLMQGGAFGWYGLASVWLQSVLELSPVQSGLTLTPAAAVAFVVAVLAARYQRLTPRVSIGCGMLLVAAGLLLMYAQLSTDSTRSDVMAGLVLTGVGVGLTTPMLVSAAVSSVPPQRMGMAAGAVNTFRQLGMTLAIAVLGAVFTGRAQRVLSDAGLVPDPHSAAAALAGGQAQRLADAAPTGRRGAAEHLVHQAFATGLQQVFLWSAVASALGGLLILTLFRPMDARPAPGGGEAARAEKPTVTA